jgi:pimeloyl-ACP methyl ester carboxylesterase
MFAAAYDRVELPGTGHFIPRERPDAVAEAIAGHLRDGASGEQL